MSGENDQSEREKERVEERAWEQQKRAEDLAWEKEKRKKDRAWEHAIRRDGMAAHGLRAILLLNGGGAVALLAFLQAIWTETTAENLVPWVIVGMVPLLVGAAASGWVHFQRYEASETYQMDGTEEGRKVTERHKRLTRVAFGMFLFGMAIVVTGAFLNQPKPTTNVLIREHGQDAPIQAAMRADAMLVVRF